jgi:hypothetical protein
MSHVALGSLFLAAGGVKILCDLLIYVQFRKGPGPGRLPTTLPEASLCEKLCYTVIRTKKLNRLR